MRHHGGAEDADREQHAVLAVEAGDETARDRARIAVDVKRVVDEAEQDHTHEPGDRELELAVAALLEAEDREGDHGGHQTRDEQGHPEEQVQRERGADELGEVGGHCDQLGLHPEAPRRRRREVLAAELGEVPARRDAHLGGQVLYEHPDQVRQQDHPQEEVAVRRATRDVGGEVAGVDVCDRRHERRPEEGQCPPQPAAALQLLQVARPAEGDGAGIGPDRRRRLHRSTSTRILLASSPPRTCTASPKRAKDGPPNGCLSTISKSAPGAIPRSAR